MTNKLFEIAPILPDKNKTYRAIRHDIKRSKQKLKQLNIRGR